MTSILEDLEDRVSALERTHHGCTAPSHTVDSSVRRARSAVESSKCYSAVWKWVPPEYYTWGYEQRRQTLGAVTTHQLCKSMLMENKACDNTDCSDRTNARYYLVVVQYEASIDASKLASEVRGLRPAGPGGNRLDPNKFDFRVASEEDNGRLTGYVTNSVTPFGLKDGTVPVVLAKAVTELEPKFMWMGGGHVDLKLGMAVEDFVKGTDALVLDVSEPRSGGGED